MREWISHAPQHQGQGPSPPKFLGPYLYPYHLTHSDQIQQNNPQKERLTPRHTPTWYDVFCKVTMWGVTFLRGPIRSDPGSGSYGAKTLGDTTTYARTIWLGWILMRDLLAVANLLVISSIIVPNHIMFSKIWLADIWMHLQENSKELTTSPDNYGRTLSDASMLCFTAVFSYFFYGRLSWPNGWTDLHETFTRG